MLRSPPVVLGKSNMLMNGREKERGHSDVKLTANGFKIGRKKICKKG
ncbi:unnamed protein product, partial [Musa textilis]